MQWNDHWRLDGQHARLGASKHHWLNYDIEKMRRVFTNELEAQRGVELHELARLHIKHKIKMARTNQTLNMFINDSISWIMDPEVKLRWDDDWFGTPDAIGFRNNTLRISDLKTGVHPGHMNQLRIYAALFFAEYGKLIKRSPHDVEIILRIYQSDMILEEIMDPDQVVADIEKGKLFAAEIKKMREVMTV